MKNIAAALIAAKKQFKPIIKNKTNPQFKSKYANLDSILDAISMALGDAGLVLVQPTNVIDDRIVLTTQLIHSESGESLESVLILPSVPDPQKLGSALTYYRRFSICSLLAIAADDDDDGNTASSSSSSNQKSYSPANYSNAAQSRPALPKTLPVSTIAPGNPGSEDVAQYQSDLKKAFEILEWESTRKAGWAKTINPAPFSVWSEADWQLALVKAYSEIDKANESTPVKVIA